MLSLPTSPFPVRAIVSVCSDVSIPVVGIPCWSRIDVRTGRPASSFDIFPAAVPVSCFAIASNVAGDTSAVNAR